MPKYKLIILDRDGVINVDSSEFIKSPADWQPLPGSLEAIARLNRAGYKVVVASNQSGIARGYFTLQELETIHNKMREMLAEIDGHIDGIYICPHGPNDNCECRKPKPGLLLKIAQEFNIAPQNILVIGDSLRDIQAAKAAGCDAMLVKTGNGSTTLQCAATELQNLPSADNLAAAVEIILQQDQTNA